MTDTGRNSCIDCIHCEPDTFEKLSLGDRTGNCNRLRQVLQFDIACAVYCLGGYVGTIEVPLNFSCASYQRRTDD